MKENFNFVYHEIQTSGSFDVPRNKILTLRIWLLESKMNITGINVGLSIYSFQNCCTSKSSVHRIFFRSRQDLLCSFLFDTFVFLSFAPEEMHSDITSKSSACEI